MKVLREDSILAENINDLEDFLHERGIVIHGIEYISMFGRDFTIKDVCSGGTDHPTLPRSFDTQRLVVIEQVKGR